MRTWRNLGIVLLPILLLALPLLVACGGSDKTALPEETPEPVGITIGNLTDLTMMPSEALAIVSMPLEDMATHYNEHNIIPGVVFEVVTYDTQYNPARDIPGYESLKKSGADLIFSPSTRAGTTLKPLLEQDAIPLFTVMPELPAVNPPGWVFGTSTCVEYCAYTFLKWIAENDPDFPDDRPARIGGASWNEPYAEGFLKAAQAYAEAHPDQYEWVYGALTEWKVSWGPEVEALKDCDYVIPNAVMAGFVNQYRDAGGRAKFIASGGHMLFFGLIDEADLCAEIDGMLFVGTDRWWNEEGETIDLVKQLLHEFHPDKAEEIIRSGAGYLVGVGISWIFSLIAQTVEAVGPEDFSPRAIYDTSLSFSLSLDGASHSFSETKRTSADGLSIYEAHAEGRDIFRVSPEWFPVVYEP